MSRSESWKMWVAVIAILIITGFTAAVWPLISSNIGGASSTNVPIPAETITIVPPPFTGLDPIELNSFLAFIILGVIVIGAVVVTGLIITGITLLVSRFIWRTEESDSYQEGNAALQKKENEKLTNKREGREAIKEQQHDYSRWAVIATSLCILMFSLFLGYLFGSSLFPTGEISTEDQVVNVTTIVISAFLLITLLILLLRMNPRRLAAVDDTDYSGIPWDTIVVILLGFLVLGLGVGLIVFLNRPL